MLSTTRKWSFDSRAVDSGKLVGYDLSLGHLKRITRMLLATAWTHDHQATVNTVAAPMQHGRFEITCDAKAAQNVSRTTFFMTGKFCNPNRAKISTRQYVGILSRPIYTLHRDYKVSIVDNQPMRSF